MLLALIASDEAAKACEPPAAPTLERIPDRGFQVDSWQGLMYRLVVCQWLPAGLDSGLVDWLGAHAQVRVRPRKWRRELARACACTFA